MSGLKSDGNAQPKNKLWYREFIVSESGGNWIVKVGHEGEMPHVEDKNTGFQPQFPKFLTSNFPSKDINPETQEDCVAKPENNCPEIKAKVAYWKENSKGVEMVKLAENAGHQIARWKGDTAKPQMYKEGHRKKLYKEGKWHNYKNPETSESKNEKLIKLEDGKAACIKGNWKDLARFCTTEANKEGDNKRIYETFCK